jgi:superfamily II DNA or RNA helicase
MSNEIREAVAQTFETEMFGSIEARWYQVATLHRVEECLEQGVKRILVHQPTGCGKTLTSGLIFSSDRVRRALGITTDRPLNLLFIAHKHRLLTQAEETYANASNVNFMPQSAFQDIPDDLEWDIACIDEAHHEAMTSIQYQLEKLGDKPIIGLTATPDRADGLLIKFEEIVCPISREKAVEEGWLAPTYLNSVIDTPATDKVPALTRLFDAYGHEMGQTMVFVRTKREVREITAYLNERFAPTRLHDANNMFERLRAPVIAQSILDQSEREVNDILNAFSAGRIRFIVNCNKINEGVDVKGCTTVVLGRQFGSYPQLNQVIGRASRPDSDCNVWELINPLSGRNLDTTVVVGTPERHRLISTMRGEYVEQEFDYVSKQQVFSSGIASQYRTFSDTRMF